MTAHQVRSYGPTVNPQHPTAGPASTYEIHVAGRLGPRWAAWFDPMGITARTDGTTVLRGSVVDQAVLHGVLQRLRDLGIPLISLRQLPPDPTHEPPAHPTTEEH